MRTTREKILLLAITALLALQTRHAAAQSQGPNIGYLYPAGGQTGSSVSVIVGGMNLRGLTGAIASGEGVSVKSVKLSMPFERLSNDLKNEIKPMLEAIEKGEDPIAASTRNSKAIISKLQKEYEKEMENRQEDSKEKKEKSTEPNPYEEMLKIVPGERLIYIDKTPEEVVKIIRGLSPLEYQCLCKSTLSKPNALQASPAIEQNAIMELEIAKDASPGFREIRLYSKNGASNPLLFMVDKVPEHVHPYFTSDDKNRIGSIDAFPSVINGQIMPGEVDRLKFKAKKGDRYAFSLMGRNLLPYLGDAVPGWFQPIISIHDKNGKTMAFADDNLFDPDPVLGFTAPSDDEYELRIRDSIYRGREDFVYRLKAEIGPTPEIEEKKFKLDHDIPVIQESENNNSLSDSQSVQYPVLIEGTIDTPGDIDFFCIEARKGDKIVAETYARRLNSPLDSLIEIMDSHGKILTFNDDWDWLNVGIQTHHSDSYCLYEIPEDGKYFIRVSETQAKGGEKFKYKLRIDRPRPDFQIYMNPSVLNTNSGSSVPFTVNLVRWDGFDFPITVTLESGPKGVRIDGNVIPAGLNTIIMTISTPDGLKEGFHKIALSAKAKISDLEISREVLPTDDVMQAFLYRHLVPSGNLSLFVMRKSWLPFRKFPEKIALKPGEEQTLSLPCPNVKGKNKPNYFLELDSAPKGITVSGGEFKEGKYDLVIRTDPEMKAWKGNLVFQCVSENKNKNNPNKSRYIAGYLPAIPASVQAEK